MNDAKESKKYTYCVVVPLYKTEFTDNEKYCLLSVKRNYDASIVYYICPQSLDTSNIISDETHIVRLEDKWFKNIHEYSLMCLSSWFYERFSRYDYMLIHQTDAYTVKNDIDYFISLGYDYYGAPWGNVGWNRNRNGETCYVGNGGYSLRNIKRMIEIVNEIPENIKTSSFNNEDNVLCIMYSKLIKCCPIDIAYKFAWETAYPQDKSILPSGFHKLWRYNKKLWDDVLSNESDTGKNPIDKIFPLAASTTIDCNTYQPGNSTSLEERKGLSSALIKATVVCIEKMENHYLREWVEHYLKLGFETVIICDNNDIDGEHPEEVIGDYVWKGKAIIKNYRGMRPEKYYSSSPKDNVQIRAYVDCFNEYKNDYDWMLFVDVDEFLILDETKTISEFVRLPKFSDANAIKFSWLYHDDNDLTCVVDGNYNMMNRFTRAVPSKESNQGKCIVKTTVTLQINSAHCFTYWRPSDELHAVNAEGEPEACHTPYMDKVSHKCAWLNHYRYKTAQEYAENKMVRLYPDQGEDVAKRLLNEKTFFAANARTPEKERIIRGISAKSNNKSSKINTNDTNRTWEDKERHNAIPKANSNNIILGFINRIGEKHSEGFEKESMNQREPLRFADMNDAVDSAAIINEMRHNIRFNGSGTLKKPDIQYDASNICNDILNRLNAIRNR